MTIRFLCECGKKLKASNDKIGKRVLCPECGQPVTVPAKSGMAVEAIDVSPDGEGPLKDSAKTARELLKLSAAASRQEQEAGERPQREARQKGEEAGFTLNQLLHNYARQAGLPLLGITVSCLLLYWISSSMFQGAPEYPDLNPVSGTVTLDDKPLEGAIVTFRSFDALIATDKVDRNVSTSNGRTDSEGQYTLSYFEDVPGAVLGQHFVEINKTGEDGREMLPARYHSKTELKTEVKADKKTGYDFQLTSGK